MALAFTHPEDVALNRKGLLSDRQRRSLLTDFSMVAFLAVVFIAVGAWLPFMKNGSKAMAAISAGIGVMVLLGSKDTWKLYRDPKPEIAVKRGQVQPFERIPINKGGTVLIGQEKIYLKRHQIREVRFGYHYEIFVAMPYGTPISADPLDV
jgi:hypothetical protein